MELLLHCGDCIADKFDWLLRGLLSATWDREPTTMSILGIRLFPLPGDLLWVMTKALRQIHIQSTRPMQVLASSGPCASAVSAGGHPDGCDRCLQTLESDCRTGKWEKARATSLCAPAERSGYAPGRKDYEAFGLEGTGKWICSAMATFWGKSMLPHLEFESCLILPFF